MARSETAQIKVVLPLTAQRLCDVTIQAHCAAGVGLDLAALGILGADA